MVPRGPQSDHLPGAHYRVTWPRPRSPPPDTRPLRTPATSRARSKPSQPVKETSGCSSRPCPAPEVTRRRPVGGSMLSSITRISTCSPSPTRSGRTSASWPMLRADGQGTVVLARWTWSLHGGGTTFVAPITSRCTRGNASFSPPAPQQRRPPTRKTRKDPGLRTHRAHRTDARQARPHRLAASKRLRKIHLVWFSPRDARHSGEAWPRPDSPRPRGRVRRGPRPLCRWWEPPA